MQLPFTVDQFYGVFRDYNTALWPMQVVLLALAIVALILVSLPRRWSGAVVSGILAFLWAWLGIAYHWAFFSAINPLAYVFAAISLIGALVFLWQGVIRKRLVFRLGFTIRTLTGIVLIVYAIVIYPIWSVRSGHAYPQLPTFGLPCPTTIFTIGILGFAVRPLPRSSLVAPVLWSFIGGQAAFLLGVPPDLGLLVAGLVGIAFMILNKQ
jgi:hypothetical protein